MEKVAKQLRKMRIPAIENIYTDLSTAMTRTVPAIENIYTSQ
jgi:hypothetical protein